MHRNIYQIPNKIRTHYTHIHESMQTYTYTMKYQCQCQCHYIALDWGKKKREWIESYIVKEKKKRKGKIGFWLVSLDFLEKMSGCPFFHSLSFISTFNFRLPTPNSQSSAQQAQLKPKRREEEHKYTQTRNRHVQCTTMDLLHTSCFMSHWNPNRQSRDSKDNPRILHAVTCNNTVLYYCVHKSYS